jgi:beta-glucanase (GH16 family)
MKPTMLKFHDRLIFKFALIGVFSALLAGCGGQDTPNPKSYDTYKPRITLLNPGAHAIVETDTGSVLIPHENICYEISAVCDDVTNFHSDMIHYKEFEGDEEVFKSLRGSITGYSEDHSLGTAYNIPTPGATARDVYDGIIDVVLNQDDISGPVTGTTDSTELVPVGDIIGTYKFPYIAKDSSGNTATLNRVVNVVDMEPPIISLNGESSLVLDFFSEFTDPGASATDNVDGPMNIDPSSVTYVLKDGNAFTPVDAISTDGPAEYKATYEVVDAAGNESSVTRVILVSPPEGEKIFILKDGAIGANWDEGITAYDQDLNWQSCLAPSGCPNIDWAFVNDSDPDSDGSPRGDVLEVTHADTERLAGVIISSSTGVNIRSATNGFLKFDLKIIEGGPSVTFKTDCGFPCSGADQFHTVSELNKWETVIVPISSVKQGGLDLGNIRAALVINGTNVQFDDTLTRFRLDNASFDCRAPECAGEETPVEFVDWAATHEDSSDPVDTTPTSYPGYALVWSDEFDGDTVNTDNWGFDIGNGDNGWGNGELQYYREENASVEDGLLIIEATTHQPRLDLGDNITAQYTSSKLKSEGKVEFKYGRVDIRAVVAKGQGMWSAGWMLGEAGQDENGDDIAWPYRGEIDIFDTIGGTRDGVPQEGMIVNNMYWNGNGADPSTDYSPSNINNNDASAHRINNSNEGTTFSNKFHTFSLIWDEDNVEFLLDGEQTQIIDISDGALAETYNNPFYLILNVAIGGDWPGPPDETTTYPDGMLVDYVRVYQTDSDGDGIADFELDGETPKDQN